MITFENNGTVNIKDRGEEVFFTTYDLLDSLAKKQLEVSRNIISYEDMKILDIGASERASWGKWWRHFFPLAQIDAIEIREDAVNKINSAYTGIYDNVYCGDARRAFSDEKYNIITGNPPFFIIEDIIMHAFDHLIDKRGGVMGFLTTFRTPYSSRRYDQYWSRGAQYKPHSLWHISPRPNWDWFEDGELRVPSGSATSTKEYLYAIWTSPIPQYTITGGISFKRGDRHRFKWEKETS